MSDSEKIKFYYLKTGDIVKEGDEYESFGDWRKVPSRHFEDIYDFGKWKPVRRKVIERHISELF